MGSFHFLYIFDIGWQLSRGCPSCFVSGQQGDKDAKDQEMLHAFLVLIFQLSR